MIQLKLKLNSNKPTTVYAANGKTYQLNPGSNVLNLEYEDYLSLAKALGIKPVDNKKQEEPENKEDRAEVKEESENKEKKEDNPSEEQEETENKEDQAEVKEEQEELENKEKKEDNPSEEREVDLVNGGVDYSAWSLKQLKSEYKKITGENCKLKKDDIISFLQERTSNA